MREWENVITEAKKLIRNNDVKNPTSEIGGYLLEGDPATPFTAYSNNKESIFSIENSGSDNASVNGAMWSMFSGRTQDGSRAMCPPSPILYNSDYWLNDDKRRMNLLYWDEGNAAWFCDKYRETTRAEYSPIIRYAEVLLSYAEAKAELGQLTDADWAKTVGAIRQRAGITGGISSKPTMVDSYLKANFYPNVDDAAIMEIRRERGCELCLEGTREDDLLRWGCGSTIVNLAWDGINFPALDTPFDADNDGVADYYFTAGNAPDAYADIAVKVNAQTGLNAVANGSVMKLTYPIASTLRYWADNRILAPIAYLTIAQYKEHGYTITQNPGY